MESTDVLEELSAVLHYMKIFKQRNKPSKTEDVHTFLVTVPAIKKFLQSKWKLSELGDFLMKYPQFFKIEKDGTVFLKDPNLKSEELECVISFFDLLRKRNNRPIHVLNACCFVTSTTLTTFLSENHNMQDLSRFFESYKGIFCVRDGLVSIDVGTEAAVHKHSIPTAVHQSTPAAGSQVPQMPNPAASTPSKLKKKDEKLVEKRALAFYVSLIAKHERIATNQAHSYIQKDVELREYLKKHYTLKDLSAFFHKYPKTFVAVNGYVCLTDFAKNSVAHISSGHSGGSVPEKAVSSTSKASSVVSSPSTASYLTPKEGLMPVGSEQTKNRSRNCSGSSSVSENKHIARLFPLLIASSPSPSSLHSRTIKGGTSDGRTARFQDAACQTISSGPILSLNVFQEFEKSS